MTALDRLMRQQELQDREIRAIRSRLDIRSRATQIQGSVPPTSGGTGISGSPLGVTLWKNASGATRGQGYVVVASVAADQSFDDTTTQGDQTVIGVLDDNDIAVGVAGRIRHIGYQAVINVQGNVAAGNYLEASTTAGRARDAGATPTAGSFARAVTAYGGGGAGLVAGMVFPPVGGTGSAAALNHAAIWAMS